MANLRDLIDGKAVDPQDKGDVYHHLKDVKDKQSEADMAKLKLHQKLAPARQMIEMVDQEHPMPGSQDQQQFDELGNPIQNPAGMNNQQMKPGMQTNPANARQQTGQNMKQNAGQPVQKKPGFPNANKASTQSKMATKKKPTDKKESGRGFEVHVKAGGERIDQMNVKKKRKQLKGRYDYHDDGGMDQGAGRGIGLSGGGPGSGRKSGGSISHIQSLFRVLSNHGFDHTSTTGHDPNDRTGHYHLNGEKDNHKVSIGSGGQWTHTSPDSKVTSGQGGRDLDNHLKKNL